MLAPLNQAFRLAAGELGMASAAWLFAAAADADNGAAGVHALRDELGRTWPVLDAVCAGWSAGSRCPIPDTGHLAELLDGATRVLLVGVEAHWLDALVAALHSGIRIGLIRTSSLDPDWARLIANHAGRVELVPLEDFQAWAGPRSVLLTHVYGQAGEQVFVLPSWLRVAGQDVRLQFRALVGWNILDVPLAVYPRWLVAADTSSFTDLVIDHDSASATHPT